MSLEPGRTLLHYRLVEKIGEGGMGVVWQAVDTSLDREVAIKLLPEAFSNDADRLARFEREAKLLAVLNHPNIAAVYGLHESEGVRFIAMELVAGETLADRLERCAAAGLPLREALEVVKQIAEALEAAHERGIVHRDLKPANVKLAPDGAVKVLDFGLARTTEAGSATGADPEGRTVTADHTTPGMVLGTVPYMSPEQARGAPVDKRADIWSLGCTLYECLVGRRPFEGATTTDTLAKIVSQPPDLDVLPQNTPDFVVRLLRRSLEKDSRRRLRDAGELRVAIEDFQTDPTISAGGSSLVETPKSSLVMLLPWILVAALGLALAYSLTLRRAAPVEGHAAVSRWSIALPEGSRVGMATPGGRFDYSRIVALSPDGSRVAFAVQDPRERVQLYLRELNELDARPIEGTTNARAPFFSPDGQWLGFLADAMIQKVSLLGGSPQKICDVGRLISFDATWAPDGQTIVYATDEGLWRVSATGGAPDRLTRPDVKRGEVGHHAPHFTPDGRGVLFTVSVTPDMHVAYLDLSNRAWEIVIRDASQGVAVDSDRIVFARSGELLVASFDTEARRLAGSAVPVLQNLLTTPGLGGVVLTQFAVSETGTLAYVPGFVEETVDRLLWVDRKGTETPITEGPGTWVHPRLSPDGQRVSVDIHSADGMRDVYIYELARGQLNRLTETGFSWESEWRPDGERVATLSAAAAGEWSLFWIRTDFSGPAELLYRSDHAVPLTWHPDGRSFLFSKHRHQGGVWRVWTEGEREAELVMASSSPERFAALSASGEWIAYVADEGTVGASRREVFVQSFPDLGPKHRISIDGGGEPVWSPDGREMFFRQDDRMLVVDLAYEPGFHASRPRVLFTGKYDAAQVGHQHYDVSRDGQRFLMIKHGEPVRSGEVRVVLNWTEEL